MVIAKKKKAADNDVQAKRSGEEEQLNEEDCDGL